MDGHTAPPVLIMTGDRPRHQYFAAVLLAAIPGARLLTERQPQSPWGSHTRHPTPLIARHFEEFHRQEIRAFAEPVERHAALLRERTVLAIDSGDINRPEVIAKIAALAPAILVSFATSLLSPAFIAQFPRRILNVHAGLSPHYRGTGTNVFPFYNNELDYVGITIHYIDAGIDSGDIIVQGRPVFAEDDDTHTIGCKNVDLAARLMLAAVAAYRRSGPPVGHRQDLSIGRLYYKKDFTDQIVTGIHANLAAGIVRSYAAVQPRPVAIIEQMSHA